MTAGTDSYRVVPEANRGRERAMGDIFYLETWYKALVMVRIAGKKQIDYVFVG